MRERLLSRGRYIHRRRRTRRRTQCRQSRIVLTRNGNLREGSNVLLHFGKVQRLHQHLRPLAIRTHGACHREEDDGNGNENTEHHTEGIEELRI